MDLKLKNVSFGQAKIKIILGLASQITYSFYFVSLMNLIRPKELYFALRIGRLDSNLNALTEDYQNYDAIFLTEYDHVFPQDTLQKLWWTGKGVVSGLYRSRTQKNHPYLVGKESNSKEGGLIYYSEFPKEEPFKTEWTGIGAMLVRREVFDLLEKPFFGLIKKGVDRDFCLKLKEHGIDIWLNPSARIGHLNSDIMW